MYEIHSDNSLIFLSLASMVRRFTPTLVDVLGLTGSEAELVAGYHVDQSMSRDEVVFSSLFQKKLGVTCRYKRPDSRRREKNKFDIFHSNKSVAIDSSILKPLCDSKIAERSKQITLSKGDFDYHLSLILRYPDLGGVIETTRNPFKIDEMTPAVCLFLRLEYLAQKGGKYEWADKAAVIMQMAFHWDQKKRCIKEQREIELKRR